PVYRQSGECTGILQQSFVSGPGWSGSLDRDRTGPHCERSTSTASTVSLESTFWPTLRPCVGRTEFDKSKTMLWHVPASWLASESEERGPTVNGVRDSRASKAT